MAFKPLHDRVLVRRVESDEKTAGGLIIPDSAKEKPAEGVVVACGEGARKDSGELIAMAVSEGDKILFGKWSGTEVTIDGVVKIVNENESVYIPVGAVHRLANPGKIAVRLIEVQTGSYLEEDDIIRLDDDFGRC